jgi:disulfide bond formation protein DsbB
MLPVLFASAGCGGNEQSNSSTASSAAAKEQAAPTLAAGDAAKGTTLYTQYCSACHGPDAKGLKGIGKDLTHNEFIEGMTDEQFLEYVKTGRAVDDPRNTTGIPMPPKGGNPALKDQEIMDIIAYIRGLQ